jgi:hypothetical protein
VGVVYLVVRVDSYGFTGSMCIASDGCDFAFDGSSFNAFNNSEVATCRPEEFK